MSGTPWPLPWWPWPWPPPPDVLYLNYVLTGGVMAITTTIHLAAGGPAAKIIVQNEGGVNLPPSSIVWSAISDGGVTVVPSADGLGFMFQAAAGAKVGSLTTVATYSGPPYPGPVVGPALNIVVVLPALQYSEVVGA